jgi:hypothetical protein
MKLADLKAMFAYVSLDNGLWAIYYKRGEIRCKRIILDAGGDAIRYRKPFDAEILSMVATILHVPSLTDAEQTIILQLPILEERKTMPLHLVGNHSDGYFVHNPATGADASVVDADGENIVEFKAVQAWVAENFPGDDVRISC